METFLQILFYTSGLIIFWAMIGYPVLLKILNSYFKNRDNGKDYNHRPNVTVVVAAHNEEKVIIQKLNNLINLNYPAEKLKILVASDNSTDKTNSLVENFIQYNKTDHIIRLYTVRKRMGKTNAQNEAVKGVDTEFIVMTDANSILEEDSISELMASFLTTEVAYVTGRLSYENINSTIGDNENSYWKTDLKLREIESNIQTITAGNGALYACRTSEYINFDPIESHDSAMPIHYALRGKKAIANHNALAYETTGETVEDEFKRKVRMNRVLLRHILPSIKILNIFKYKWFTVFYLGHRTSRYLLWISHFIFLLTNILILFINPSILYSFILTIQLSFHTIALLKRPLKIDNKYVSIVFYYNMTIFAQWKGVINTITGESKPFWDKVDSTRKVK